MGRIRISCEEVLGAGVVRWAMPCAPYAGPGLGFFAIPPVGANVWVEFERGEPEHPIWTGCFWDEKKAPVDSPSPDKKVLKTKVATITLNDADDGGGITVETNKEPKMKIVVDSKGIEISNGKGASVKLNDKKVSINGSALEVE